MQIPGYQQWMNDTALGITKPRSALLKGIDTAIQQYEQQKTQQNLFKIKNAFENWKRSRDGAWEGSERNRLQAITKLNAALSTADYRTYQITQFSMQELLALQFVNKERKRVIASVFKDKAVTLKAARLKDAVKSTAQDVADTSEKAAAYIRSIGKDKSSNNSGGRPVSDMVRQKFESMVQSLFSVDTLDQLGSLSGVILTILGKVGVSVAPVVAQRTRLRVTSQERDSLLVWVARLTPCPSCAVSH